MDLSLVFFNSTIWLLTSWESDNNGTQSVNDVKYGYIMLLVAIVVNCHFCRRWLSGLSDQYGCSIQNKRQRFQLRNSSWPFRYQCMYELHSLAKNASDEWKISSMKDLLQLWLGTISSLQLCWFLLELESLITWMVKSGLGHQPTISESFVSLFFTQNPTSLCTYVCMW